MDYSGRIVNILLNDAHTFRYEYKEFVYQYTCTELKLKGYSYKYSKHLKYHCWHDPCGWNLGHDYAKIPHQELTESEKSRRDHTRSEKDNNKKQVSSKTLIAITVSITTLICGFSGYIIRSIDPNNIANISKAQKETIFHLSHENEKILSECVESYKNLQKAMNHIQSNTNITKKYCLNMWSLNEKNKN